MTLKEPEAQRLLRIAPQQHFRARADAWVRSYFERHGFLEVHTPFRVAAPGTDVYIDPQPSGEEWLITSPEFHMKRLVAAGYERVFQLARCHRRGEVGLWHQPEFTLLEWYRAGATLAEVQEDTANLVLGLAHLAATSGPLQTPLELDAPLKLDTRKLDTQKLSESGALRETVPAEITLQAPFAALTVRSAFAQYAGIEDAAFLARTDEDRYFQLFVDCVEPALSTWSTPVFLTEYPLSQAALAQPCPHDPSVAERFELYIAGVELCNGYGELTDPALQRARFEQDQRQRALRGLPALPIDEPFLQALERGMPSSCGNALGFERLLALLLGCPLSDLFAFPAEVG